MDPQLGSNRLVTEKSIASPPHDNIVWIPGGAFLMRSDHHNPEEAPAHKVSVKGFWMDVCTLTNRDLSRFVEVTGYVTSAERPANPDDFPGAKHRKPVKLGARRSSSTRKSKSFLFDFF